MVKQICLCAALAAAAPSLHSRPAAQLGHIPTCLHDDAETQEQRARREGAVRLAKAIVERQAEAAERTRLYAPLPALRNLPPAPRGFDVRLYTDGVGFVLSLKDTLDPCKFAIFSDESGFVYEKAALTAPLLAR
jgi:hypothetical protein